MVLYIPSMDPNLNKGLPLAIGPLSIVSDPSAYLSAAKVAAQYQIPYIHSLRSSLSMQLIDSSCGPSTERWLELFPFEDEGFLRSLVLQAKHYNYRAILLTLDDEFTSIEFPSSMCCNFSFEESKSLARLIAVLRNFTDLPIVLNIPVERQRVLQDTLAPDAVCLTIGTYTLFSDFVDAIKQLKRQGLYKQNVYVSGTCFTEAEVALLISHGVQRVLIDQPVVWGLMIDGLEGIANVIDIYKRKLLSINQRY